VPRAPQQVASAWRGPDILANVPADTPYLFGLLQPAPPAIRDRLVSHSGEQVKDALKRLASGEGRGALVAAALYSELDGTDPTQWFESLGLARDGRFVIYGLSLFPVLRFEVKDPVRVRQVLERIVHAGDPDLQPQSVGRAMVYVLKDARMSTVFGIVDKELIAAVAPTDRLDRALPAIIGTQPPAHSLRDAKVLPALLERHRYLPTMIAFLDSGRVFDALTGHGKGEYDQLESMLDGKLSAVCADDLHQVASVIPRIALGYRRLDEQGFTMTAAIEVPASIVKSLAKLHTPMPAMPQGAQPLFAMGAAVNVDAMLDWMRDVTGKLRAHPFRCESADKLNQSIAELATTLSQPVPPMVQGLRGFELVIDDATVMPPAGTGSLLVVGDHIADLIRQTLVKIPQLAALNLQPNGLALALPLDKLGVPSTFKSAHFALRETRAALAVGDSSATRVSERVSAPDARAPLLTLSYDLPKMKERFGMFLGKSFAGITSIASTSMSLDVGDDGIYVEMVGTWTHGR
jgi:hypothetical protein